MYFGSVRFFKNLILLVIIILIAVPTVFAIRLNGRVAVRDSELARLGDDLSDAQDELTQTRADAQSRLADMERELNAIKEERDAAEEEARALTPEMIYYQSLYPDFYAPQEYQAAASTPGTVYLTFDDGPSGNTEAILDALDEADVKATFFVVGQTSETNLRRMKEIADRGHTVGMHSWSHSYSQIYSSVEAFLDDMYQIFTQIKETTGTAPTFFRCPGGSINGYNGGVSQEIISEMMRRGFVPCDWNLSAEDAVTGMLSTDQIRENVLSGVNRVSSGYVLMHDSSRLDSTVEALPGVINDLRELGFQFARLTPDVKPVLFGYKN